MKREAVKLARNKLRLRTVRVSMTAAHEGRSSRASEAKPGRFCQSEIDTNGNSPKKSFVWKQKHEGGIKFKPNEYYLYYVLNFRGRYEDINGRIYIRDELSV